MLEMCLDSGGVQWLIMSQESKIRGILFEVCLKW